MAQGPVCCSRRALITSAAILTLGLWPGSQTPGARAQQATPPSAAATPAAGLSDAAIARFIERQWFPAATGGGGYSGTIAYLEKPTLYATSWFLQLARWYDILPAIVDPARVADFLMSAIARPKDGESPDVMHNLLLAVQGLAALDQTVPVRLVKRQLERLLTPDGFVMSPGDEPSWVAEFDAQEIRESAGLPTPPETVARVRRELGAHPEWQSETRVVPDEDGEIIAFWLLADRLLPKDERAPFRPWLAEQLRYEDAALTGGEGLSGYVLGTLADIRQIGRDNDIPLPPIDQSRLEWVTRHLDTAASTRRALDAQVVFGAARLGLPLSDPIVAYVDRTAGPNGWTHAVGDPEPRSTLHGLLINHALGLHDRDEAIALLVATWLDEAREQPDLLGVADELLYTVALARRLDLPVPDTIPGALRRTLTENAFAGADLYRASTPVRLARDLNITPPAEFAAFITRLGETAPLFNSDDAYALWSVAWLGGESLSRRALDHLATLAVGSDAYRFSVRLPVPDTRSTVRGLAMTGELARRGPTALALFTNADGTWYTIPGTPEASDEVDLQTTYLGFVLAGRIDLGPEGVL